MTFPPLASVIGRRSLWALVAVVVAVLLAWAGLPSKSTHAGAGGESLPIAAVQPGSSVKDSAFETYRDWIATMHQRTGADTSVASLPDQF